ncbi:MAG: polyphosphate kinase 2 [Pyrinomonadaceae bacterium]|nr:polyphosphate kinase 2 [Pyrinomonadaceae bacterium]
MARTINKIETKKILNGNNSENLTVKNEVDKQLNQPDSKRSIRQSTESVTENNNQVIVPIEAKFTATELENVLVASEFNNVRSIRPLMKLLNSKGIRIKNAERNLKYEDELEKLQIELVKLQRWVQEHKRRVAILFEGRDAAGKGGTIRRFIEHLNPRAMRVVALPKPTEEEVGQWYFQRYVRQLPNQGEIVFFDRSWYNRAVVEPVMGFCSDEQYEQFMRQVTEFEHMLYEDGITVIKFWFSISKEEQQRRFAARELNPLKQWKLSPIDQEAQGMWDRYTMFKEKMFSRTHTTFSPWIIVQANDKKNARLESIRYVLSALDYEGKGISGATLYPDPNIITRFHRLARGLD